MTQEQLACAVMFGPVIFGCLLAAVAGSIGTYRRERRRGGAGR